MTPATALRARAVTGANHGTRFHLEIDMKKMQRKFYAVHGSGELPLDMLRYDYAWPASESDANNAQRNYNERLPKRIIVLATDSHSAPNTNRWASFRWNVLCIAPSLGDVHDVLRKAGYTEQDISPIKPVTVEGRP